jgi:hypothetical protein
MTTHAVARATLAALTVVGIGCFAAAPAHAQGSGGTASGGTEGGAPRLPQGTPPATAGQSATGSGTGSVGNGVIHPPSQVDPGIRRPTPPSQTFTMPVVPPPGTPGGQPGAIAK